MKSHRHETQTISEQAAEWLCVLAEGGAAEQAALLEWLKKSPCHVEEFLFASATWMKLREVGARLPMPVEAILAEVLTPGVASNVVALGRDPDGPPESAAVTAGQVAPVSETSSARKPWRRYQWAAAVATLALAAALGWSVVDFGSTYSTRVGEQRTVSLEDGSVLYLNTDSRARVHFSRRNREIELLEGEALFVVAHDRKRPFLVSTADAVVQAVGTQFNVRRLADDTRVSVIEGRVKVAHDQADLADDLAPVSKGSAHSIPLKSVSSHAQKALERVEFLTAGEEATIVDNGGIVKAPAADIAQAIAWRERRLVFKAETLENVVAEINRYSARPFRIEGEHARRMQLTATLSADQPDSLATFLQQYVGLSVDARGSEFVIRER